jgi:hypothetical protein
MFDLEKFSNISGYRICRLEGKMTDKRTGEDTPVTFYRLSDCLSRYEIQDLYELGYTVSVKCTGEVQLGDLSLLYEYLNDSIK